MDICEMVCDALNANCPEWGATADCMGSEPKFACDGDDDVYAVGCEKEWACAKPCFNEVVPPECATSNSKADCKTTCAAVVAASCQNGPPNVGACVPVCEKLNTECPEWGAAVDCMGPNPTFSCDAGGNVVVVGCEKEFDCTEPCFESMMN